VTAVVDIAATSRLAALLALAPGAGNLMMTVTARRYDVCVVGILSGRVLPSDSFELLDRRNPATADVTRIQRQARAYSDQAVAILAAAWRARPDSGRLWRACDGTGNPSANSHRDRAGQGRDAAGLVPGSTVGEGDVISRRSMPQFSAGLHPDPTGRQCRGSAHERIGPR